MGVEMLRCKNRKFYLLTTISDFLTKVSQLTQPFFDKHLHFLPDFRRGNLIEHFVAEGHLLQQTGLRLRNAARTQIEEFVRVETADRRAVAALYVVGIYLELRLRISLGRLTGQQIVVGLIGFGLLDRKSVV